MGCETASETVLPRRPSLEDWSRDPYDRLRECATYALGLEARSRERQRELDDWRRRAVAAEAGEQDLRSALIHLRQYLHLQHHHGPIVDCPQQTCAVVRRAIEGAREGE